MQLITYLILIIIQDVVPYHKPDYAEFDPPAKGAFDNYLPMAADALIFGGALLALLSAYRIYKNAILHKQDLFEGTVNLISGMVFLILIRLFFQAMF